MERFTLRGEYFFRNGIAKDRGLQNRCQKSLYLYSKDQNVLFDITLHLSNDHDCFEVKVSKESRGGIFVGICSFTNENTLGDTWAKYELHPEARVSIQDNDFYLPFKNSIRTYK